MARPSIACLGAGRMGRGIAVVFAYAGHEVTVVDFKARDAAAFATLAAGAMQEVRATLSTLARFGLFDAGDVDRIVARVRVRAANRGAGRAAPGGRDLRGRPGSARHEARGVCPRLDAGRPGADHRLHHLDHPGR